MGKISTIKVAKTKMGPVLKEIRKNRVYTIKNRLYIEGKYLNDAEFEIGKKITYKVDNVKKQVTVVLTNEASRNSVAQTTVRSGAVVPVIDIKAKDVKEFFQTHNDIQVSVCLGQIIFTVKEAIKNNVIELKSQVKSYAINVSELAMAVGCEQTSIFNLFHTGSGDDGEGDLPQRLKTKAISLISLFSGCGMLDKGFLDNGGYEYKFAVDRFGERELKDYHIQTYRENIGDHIVMKDVLDLKEEDIPQADFVMGGVPCVSFSNLNTLSNFGKSDAQTHPLVEKYIQIVKWAKAKAFLIENVPNFLTVKGGLMFQRLKESFSDFKIVARKISATELGSPQKRERVFIFGMHDGYEVEPTIKVPHVAKVTTVKDAFKNIENVPQQDLFFKATEKVLEMFRYIPQGGTIKDCPLHLRPPNKKFSNFCQRLAENTQCPTITHVQDDRFFHPTIERYLTVRETARLFSMPDDFVFKGSLTSIFEQLKNGVDYKVSSFLARIIKEQLLPNIGAVAN